MNSLAHIRMSVSEGREFHLVMIVVLDRLAQGRPDRSCSACAAVAAGAGIAVSHEDLTVGPKGVLEVMACENAVKTFSSEQQSADRRQIFNALTFRREENNNKGGPTTT